MCGILEGWVGEVAKTLNAKFFTFHFLLFTFNFPRPLATSQLRIPPPLNHSHFQHHSITKKIAPAFSRGYFLKQLKKQLQII